MRKLIVGLGNPGREYQLTRHNAGRIIVEKTAALENAPFSLKRRLDVSLAVVEWQTHEVLLAFPEVFMNVSGAAVARAVKHCGIDPVQDLLIVVDDLALPFSRLRLRQKGSAGGHNGLLSIEQALASSSYSRLRVGIGHPQDRAPGEGEAISPRDYVLSRFSKDEKAGLEDLCQRAFEACRLWVCEPAAKAMSIVNDDVIRG